MTTWQRWLRIALGVFVVVFAAGVYLAMRKPPQPGPRKPAAPIDDKAITQVNRGKAVVLKGGAVDYTIEYQSVAEYLGDRMVFHGVTAHFPGREGRDLRVTGEEASATQDKSNFTIHGNVHFGTSDGLSLLTSDASYAQAEGIVRVPGRVDFSRGAMRGSGVGMTYDQKRDIITLLDQFEMTSQAAEGQPPTEVHAGTGTWARTDKYMRFERNAKIIRGGQTLEGDVATLKLTDDEQHVQLIELRGNSRITGTPTTPAAGTTGAANAAAGATFRGMHARDITLTYGEGGETLQQAVLAGQGALEVSSTDPNAPTRITGEFIDLGLEPDGATVQSLAARGASPASLAELQLPPQAGAPPRVIRARSIQGPRPGARPKPGEGLTTMRFTDSVEYRELPAPPASPRVATSRILDLVLQPGFGGLDEATFLGSAALTEGTSLAASAANARYDVTRGSFEFTGNDDRGRPPQVKDAERATVEASRIVVTPEGRKIAAFGSVRTTFHSSSDAGNVHTPGILDDKQPVFAIADELQYEGEASQAVFTSKGPSKTQSRLWQTQGGTSISAVEISLDDSKGDLRAKGSVTSSMLLEQVDHKTNRTERTPTTVNADQLFYEDATHRATYTGHVRMKGGVEGDLKTDKAVLNLTDDGRSLRTLDGYENVEVHDDGTATTGARTATGDRLHYTAATEEYVITGKLVKINEECYGETVGRQLTFYRSVDRMIVDGNTERRTQTKGGQGCKKEPRFD